MKWLARLSLRTRLQGTLLRGQDAWDVLLRRRPAMTPSRVRIAAVGGGDFLNIGEHLAQLVIEAGRLQPHERVLDVACGIGRLAVPLTRYLERGEYTGFDVSLPAIRWCRREISRQYPNFSFIRVDVFNGHYNARGRIRPAEFVFPCADSSVDVAFLGSILTHLTPNAAARYVAETSRVLKAGGRAVMTFFLLDEVVSEKSRRGELVPAFKTYPEPWWAVQDAEDLEAAVAYDINVVEGALREQNLQIEEVSRGAWSTHQNARTYQDVIVAVKTL